ncbi:hypothetical protein M0813_23147 [Anaeramoeba flamelloides]|uniref:Uncharacterized protein n=1 Tax=Anaeramoeba flamelloides TaxID=1746091 RepID=A0ABQ8YAX8_9EUKA|nr:hypothetical protein M0813_23147 [Anaeramoeba flamelloides]
MILKEKISLQEIMRQIPLRNDLIALEQGIDFGGIRVKFVNYQVTGDLKDIFPNKGMKDCNQKHSCSTCLTRRNTNQYVDFDTKMIHRNVKNIQVIQLELNKRFKNVKNLEDLTLLKLFQDTSGVSCQSENIFIQDLGMDPTDCSYFPICWMHLILEGLLNYSITQFIQELSTNDTNLILSRFNNIELPHNFSRLDKPLRRKQRTSKLNLVWIQLINIIILDLNYPKYAYLFKIFQAVLSNLYLPYREDNDDKIISQLLKSLSKNLIELFGYTQLNKKPNMHILKHLADSIVINGGITTHYMALERRHQSFIASKRHICKNYNDLLELFAKEELFKKYIEFSLDNFQKSKYEVYYYKLNQNKYLNIYKNNKDTKNQNLNFNYYSLKFVENRHIFKLGSTIISRTSNYYKIRGIFYYEKNSIPCILVQQFKENEKKTCFFKTQIFGFLSPGQIQNIVHLIKRFQFNQSELSKKKYILNQLYISFTPGNLCYYESDNI